MKVSTQIAKQVSLTTSNNIQIVLYKQGTEVLDIMEFKKAENTLKSGKLASWLTYQIDEATFSSHKVVEI